MEEGVPTKTGTEMIKRINLFFQNPADVLAVSGSAGNILSQIAGKSAGFPADKFSPKHPLVYR